jgi:hypothetical protein
MISPRITAGGCREGLGFRVWGIRIWVTAAERDLNPTWHSIPNTRSHRRARDPAPDP